MQVCVCDGAAEVAPSHVGNFEGTCHGVLKDVAVGDIGSVRETFLPKE